MTIMGINTSYPWSSFTFTQFNWIIPATANLCNVRSLHHSIKMVDQVGVEPTFIQLCTYRLEGAANTDPY